MDAAPGSVGILLLAYDGTVTSLQPFGTGLFLPGFVASLGPLAVPSSGNVQLPFAISNRFPLADVFHAQFLTFDPATSRFWGTNTFPLNVNR